MTDGSQALDSRQHVIQACRDNDVKFVRLWFTDILGLLKSVAITVEELEHALDDGVSFDGASIEGFARSAEADMVLAPDPATFQLLPWRPREQAVARMFCDVREPSGEPFEGDPRWVLKRALARAADAGYTFYVSPEIEFFYFRDQHSTEALDAGGYFDLTPLDGGTDLRRQTVLTLEEMGIPVALSHHEAAPSQHEIDLRYTDALAMADSIMTYRLVVKEVALQQGVYATFMPKPLSDQNGSGMHLQLSLFRGEENAFFGEHEEFHLSVLAKQYVSGLLRHAPEMMLITNQWVNSYKRLIPGFEAPTHTTWSAMNHADLVRVPQYRPGYELSTRVEYRAPDAACNPYLMLAALLSSGLAGVEGEYSLPSAVDQDVREFVPEELEAHGIEALPDSLGQAIEQCEQSDLMRDMLGDQLFESLLANKRHEWAQYRSQITEFEIDRYLSVL